MYKMLTVHNMVVPW